MTKKDVRFVIEIILVITAMLLVCGIGIVLYWGTVKAIMAGLFGITTIIVYGIIIKELCKDVFEKKVESK